MPKKLAIWGASGHARVVADAIRLLGAFEIVGFLDDVNKRRAGERFCGKVVLGGKEQLAVLHRGGVRDFIVGFGDCWARLEAATVASEQGFQLVTIIHPGAVVAKDVVIEQGTFIAAGAVVNPAARIGKNVIVNTCASVDHECVLDDGAHVAPGAHLAGRVLVGRAALIGIGSTVADRIRIGEGAQVGAGSLVLHDIPDGALAYGSPARVVGGAPRAGGKA